MLPTNLDTGTPVEAPFNTQKEAENPSERLQAKSAADEYVDPLKDKEDLQKALIDILKEFDQTEESNRINNIRIWKKCENYWHHIQDNYWSTATNDWMSPEFYYKNNQDYVHADVASRTVNIYRAHGESIVAALSVNTPTVRFFPEDADTPDDIVTAKAFSKIGGLIERQNKAKLLLMRMIYILYNQGMVAVHNYSHESEEYGTKTVPIHDKKKAHFADLYCSTCGEKLQSLGPQLDKPIDIPEQPVVCQACGNEGVPIAESSEKEEQFQIGEETRPKIRQKLAAYGPLNVKISSYAYDQRSIGILAFDAEQDFAKAQEMYPKIADKIRTGPITNEVSVNARKPNSLYDTYTKNNVTVRQVWMRPWMFNKYAKAGNPHNDTLVSQLKELFPNGVCFHAVNDVYAESYSESLDSAWSLSFNPLSRYAQGDPIGLPLIPIQDMTNELVNFELESIEFGIPETFVDPEVLDLNEYKQSQGGPGMVFPIKPQVPGGDISKSFYTNKTSTLTDESGRFRSRLDSDGQFITGDYPSIYGGPNSGDTAAEYSMSRQQALQRLSITWTIINFLWADVMKNAVKGYVANVKEDEHYVEQGATKDDFVNIWIRQDDLKGSIGEVYPEAAEQFPMSWAQKREVLMTLMSQQNELVNAVIVDPNNRTEVAALLGLPNLYIPGDQDRRKQLTEIGKLVMEDPLSATESSIMPEFKIDDHLVHMQTCKYWMNSEVGQYYKEQKPARYANVMLHNEQHEMMMMGEQQQQGQAPAGQPEPTAAAPTQ